MPDTYLQLGDSSYLDEVVPLGDDGLEIDETYNFDEF